MKAEKSEIHRDTIMFLGYVISQKGVEMDESKVEAVTTLAGTYDCEGTATIPRIRQFL